MRFVMVVGSEFLNFFCRTTAMNTSSSNRTRWLTLAGTIITQFALGSVYTWSLFNSALAELGEPVSQVAFSLAC
jgi:OFA family oxalate/formate antiporter-like MFS transporter